MDKVAIQCVVAAMDILGWEQDGRGKTFVDVKYNGGRKTFKTWEDVSAFAVERIKAQENAK